MGWFRRRRSTIDERIARAQAMRSLGSEVRVDELPVVQGLAQLHADVVASLDLYVEDSRGVRATDPPAIIVQPDPLEDRFDTMHKLVQSLYWRGNSFGALAGAGSGPDVMSMRILNPYTVGHLPDVDDSTMVAGWFVNGIEVDRSAVAHWKINDNPTRGPLGHSPLQNCQSALDMYGWAYRYLRDFFANGGNPSMALRSNRPLAPAKPATDTEPAEMSEAEAAQIQWVESRQLARPAVFDPQWSIEEGPAAQDLEQTIRVLEFGAVEVARMMGVAPSIVNAMSSGSLTYSTVADELQRWVVLSLGPTWLVRIENGFTRLLAGTGLRARFDRDLSHGIGLTRPEPVTTNPPAPILKAVA